MFFSSEFSSAKKIIKKTIAAVSQLKDCKFSAKVENHDILRFTMTETAGILEETLHTEPIFITYNREKTLHVSARCPFYEHTKSYDVMRECVEGLYEMDDLGFESASFFKRKTDSLGQISFKSKNVSEDALGKTLNTMLYTLTAITLEDFRDQMEYRSETRERPALKDNDFVKDSVKSALSAALAKQPIFCGMICTVKSSDIGVLYIQEKPCTNYSDILGEDGSVFLSYNEDGTLYGGFRVFFDEGEVYDMLVDSAENTDESEYDLAYFEADDVTPGAMLFMLRKEDVPAKDLPIEAGFLVTELAAILESAQDALSE